jgi:hypothetical protein
MTRRRKDLPTDGIMLCLACGTAKDMATLEVYPYPKDDCLCDSPLPPLLDVDCQAAKVQPDGSWEFRNAIMCHECWHKLVASRGIDMWIGQECWESLNPVTPFDKLPRIEYEER